MPSLPPLPSSSSKRIMSIDGRVARLIADVECANVERVDVVIDVCVGRSVGAVTVMSGTVVTTTGETSVSIDNWSRVASLAARLASLPVSAGTIVSVELVVVLMRLCRASSLFRRFAVHVAVWLVATSVFKEASDCRIPLSLIESLLAPAPSFSPVAAVEYVGGALVESALGPSAMTRSTSIFAALT